MKISAERVSLDVWTVTIDGNTRTGMTRDEAWKRAGPRHVDGKDQTRRRK